MDNNKENLTKRKYTPTDTFGKEDLCDSKCPYIKSNKCSLYDTDLIEWELKLGNKKLNSTGYFFRCIECINNVTPSNVEELLKETNSLLRQILKNFNIGGLL